MLGIVFTNRRITVKIHQTIKNGTAFGEFIKFELGEEADIPDGVDSREARTQLFKKLLEESTIREAVIKALNDKDQIEQAVRLLQQVFSASQTQPGPVKEPAPHYYGPNDMIDDEEGMSKAQVTESRDV